MTLHAAQLREALEEIADGIDRWTAEGLVHIAKQALSLPSPSAWLPIEDAPKDGTRILGYGMIAGEINGIDTEPSMTAISFSGGSTDYVGFSWIVQGTDAYAAWMMPEAWQPLPTPPETPRDN